MARRATRAASLARREVGGPFAGVDEAGRGPVLGPLVVAGVRVDDDKVLRKLAVKDSKKLTPAAREAMYPRILDVARVAVRIVPHDELNARMPQENLNAIEVAAFADVLNELNARMAFVDAADVVPERFGSLVTARLSGPCHVVSEHKADDRYPTVAAASVVAKVLRDREIEAIGRALGCEIGSGYSHDPVTRQFLRDWVKDHDALPPCARIHWEPARMLMNRSLDEYAAREAPP